MKKTQPNRLIAAAPSGDEDAAEDQRQDDADQQGELLQLPRHLQLGHDDDEDEQVVDRQAVLGQPAGEELPGVPRAGDAQTARPKITASATKMPMNSAGLLHRWLVRPAADDEDVDRQDGDHHDDGDDPGVQVNVHRQVALPRRGQTKMRSRRSLPPAG